MFNHNPLVKLLGISYPILEGATTHFSESNLASTISNHGGLGVIGASLMEPEWLKKEIEKTKKLTKNPFGVSLFLRNPKIEELVKLVIQSQVPIVFTYGGNPLPYFFHFQAAGIKIIPIVPSPRLAKKMEENGAEAVVLQAFETMAFFAQNTTFSLIPQTKKLIKKIPLIAFGGIHDPLTAKAAFLLGADGIQMETRFLASKESQISEAYKKKIVQATTDDLKIILEFTDFPLRVIKNQWSEEMQKLEKRGAFPEEIKFEEIREALNEKDIENSPLLASLSTPGISEIKSCQEIIEEIITELKETILN